LVPTKLAQGLPAVGCKHCDGALISMLYYRDWIERYPVESEMTEENSTPDTADSATALHCPKCSRIMTKYRIDSEVGNRLDICAACGEAWLDNGEWKLLQALQLSRHLPRVFTDAWQLKIKQDMHKTHRRTRYLRVLGETDLSRVEKFRDWLATHPRRQDILQLIMNR